MATTTTNYGFDIPQSTDLVKDGATAIATLGQDIDTAMNTALGTKKAGMVLLNTTSFSGVASQSFNDVFSATYNSYMLVFSNLTCVTGTTNNLMMRLRVSGTDNSSNNYENGRYFVGAFQATAAASTDSELESRFLLGQMTNLIQQGGIVYVHNPFLTANTAQNSLWASSLLDINAGVTTVTTSYTGFTVFPAAGGNIAGTVSIYGLAK